MHSSSGQAQTTPPKHIKSSGEIRPDLKRVLHNQGSRSARKTFIWMAKHCKKLESDGPVSQSDVCLTFKSKDENNLILHVAACQSKKLTEELKVHVKSKGNGN